MTSPLDIALDYIGRGWNPVPVNYRAKKPSTGNGWQLRVIDEARAIAPYILPRTGAIFGRASSRAAHRLYYTDLSVNANKAVVVFKDPTTGGNLLELRIGGDSGAQTVFPGSIHEDGEPIA